MSESFDIDRPSVLDEPASVQFNGTLRKVRRGTTVAELMEIYPEEGDEEVIGALVNNRLVSLAARIVRSGCVELISIRTRRGARLYQRHLTIMLYEVFNRLFPGADICIGQAISEGHYFHVRHLKVDDRFLEKLEDGIRALAAAREPFVFRRVPVEEARRMFTKRGEQVKHQLLDQWSQSHVSVVQLRGFTDLCLSPVAPHTGYFNKFNLYKLEDNAFVLQFPNLARSAVPRNEGPQPKLYATHKNARRHSELMGVAHLPRLNQMATTRKIKDVIRIAEGLHEKQISNIADQIAGDASRKLVFVSGPSSAGKTTFAKRLSTQLQVAGVCPKALSLDNYYVDRVDTPLDEHGKWDFEALEAIDLPRFNEDLRQLLDGAKVATPVYDFNKGERAPKEKWNTMSLAPHDVLIIEGIHGLNDALTPAIDNKEKFRIYINALNPLAIDHHNRLNTSDVRLIRRIVRDRHYRGYSATQTINNWSSVRRGERAHIFPFQESADVIFDTSLIYEFSVLKVYAERYLLEVPRTDVAFAEAFRLKSFLSMFVTVLPGDVPNNSLLREFIGGSSFSYK